MRQADPSYEPAWIGSTELANRPPEEWERDRPVGVSLERKLLNFERGILGTFAPRTAAGRLEQAQSFLKAGFLSSSDVEAILFARASVARALQQNESLAAIPDARRCD